IDVQDELTIDISGKGTVRYVTPPKVINKDISGLGKVGDQGSTSGGDTTRITIGDSEILIVDKIDTTESGLEDKIIKRKQKNSVQPFWGGLEMGFNGYLNADNKTSMQEGYEFLELNESKSLAVNINLFQTKIKLEKDHLWVVSGLGLAYNNYRFAKRNFKLAPEVDMVTALTDSVNAYNFDKSKLVATYVTVPLLLQVNTSKSKRNNFHLSTGGIFGYKIGSHTKYLTKNGSRKKEKERDDFNLEPIRLDATVRVGYKNFNIFANYAVTELFKDGEGPELHPYTIGLTIIGW
ncbi:MAG: outer membrane beta-barrel protein, partial [Bacteroidia bacterium]|nr:outer membrane beta-barrel protein [Bacteroidia bacterium]